MDKISRAVKITPAHIIIVLLLAYVCADLGWFKPLAKKKLLDLITQEHEDELATELALRMDYIDSLAYYKTLEAGYDLEIARERAVQRKTIQPLINLNKEYENLISDTNQYDYATTARVLSRLAHFTDSISERLSTGGDGLTGPSRIPD